MSCSQEELKISGNYSCNKWWADDVISNFTILCVVISTEVLAVIIVPFILSALEPGEAPNNSPSILAMLETLQSAPYLDCLLYTSDAADDIGQV